MLYSLSVIVFAIAFITLLHRGQKLIWGLPFFLSALLFADASPITMSIMALIWLCLAIPFIRCLLVTRWIFRLIQKSDSLPTISKTEETALAAGSTWIESEYFSGNPNLDKILNIRTPKCTNEELDFLNNEVNEVCEMVTDWQIFQDKDLPIEVWQYLKTNKFFGLNLKKEYGGLEFSAYAQSLIVQKLTTRSQVLGITVMVPNSLGPAELLFRYGTVKQKQYYLPRLATGREIPCFALTEPLAGSDASAITSEGIVFKDEDNTLKIKLTFEKRFITLGGVATLIGLAFQLKDPQNLLPKEVPTGITCALIKNTEKNLIQNRRHDPLGVPFINSPLVGKDIIINIADDVIGGMSGIGIGWTMLLECLAVGRGISLPATAAGGAKYATKVAYMHSRIRSQFNVSIEKFEAVEEKLTDMMSWTYSIDAICIYTASGIMLGYKPAVANAIAKYHTTEMYRNTINAGMDILGGSGICLGSKNLLAHGYMGAPIAITVEGANIMTRALMQFGQGVIRCHPYVQKQIQAIASNSTFKFDISFWGNVSQIIRNKCRIILFAITKGHIYKPFDNNIETIYQRHILWISANFSFMTDLSLVLYQGRLKKMERISGRFADILSGLYTLSALLKKFTQESKEENTPLLKYSCDQVLLKIDFAFKLLHRNLIPQKTFTRKVFNWLCLLGCYKFNTPLTEDDEIKEFHKNIHLKPKKLAELLPEVFISKNFSDKLSNLNSTYLASFGIRNLVKQVKKHGTNEEKALKDGIINQDEYDLLYNWNQLSQSLIQVDDFELTSTNASKANKFSSENNDT